MPQASAELQNQMIERFGSLDDGPVIAHLEKQGYTLTREGFWKKDGIKEYKDMERFDFECLMFLAHEWDFGGLEQ